MAEAYNIGMSTADSMVGAKALGPAYSVIAGMGAAADASEDIYDRGGTTDQVFWGGFAAGAAEMVFEYVSIDKLLTNSAAVDTAKGYFKNIVKQAGIEASEEVLTEISNKVFDNLIMDEKSAFSLRVKELVDDGMSVQEAQEQATAEQIYDVIWAAVAGGVSGGTGAAVLGGGALYTSKKANKSLGQDLREDSERVSGLFKYAASVKGNSEISAILKHNTSTNISDKDLGRLYKAVYNDVKNSFKSANSIDEVKSIYGEILKNDQDGVLIGTAISSAKERIGELSKDADEDFVKLELLMGAVSQHQQTVLSELPDSVLTKAYELVLESGSDVDAASVGINPQSEFYKKLESAGIANSEGKISAEAIANEVSRREQKQRDTAHRVNDVGRPVGDALENGLSTNGIPELDENVKDNSGNDKQGDFFSVGEIAVNMSEFERAEILRHKSVTPVEVSSEQSKDFDFEELRNNIKSKVEKALLKKFRELGFLKKYSSTAIGDIEFEFTGGGVRKSLNSQETLYGGTKADFAKAAANLQKLLDNAVLIETHTDKGIGTEKENQRLKQVYVLLSVMRDGDGIIPVQFEVKQYVDNNNRLYLAVALTKIETSVVDDTASKEMRTRLLPVSDISIPDLFSKINPEDRNFLKYIPDEFLNDEQIASKQRAQKEETEKYGESEQGGFSDVEEKEIFRRKSPQEISAEATTGRYRTPTQMQAESVAELFGVKLWWDEKLTSPYYDFEAHRIFMSSKMTISDIYAVMFKHELVHHFELKKGYDGFKNYLFKKSPAFAKYCYDCIDRVNDAAFDGTYEEAIKAYTDYKYEQYKSSDEIPELVRKRFTKEMAEMEIVADFVGDELLFGRDVGRSMEALTEIAQTDRNLFQRIRDWIKDKLKALKKRREVQDSSLIRDLEYLENRLKRVWDSKDKKASTDDAGVKYKLNEYSQHQKDNWSSSKRIILYENEPQYKKFIEDSLSGKITDKKIYFGAVSSELANFIKNSTGIYVENYNCSLSSDEILKINKDHGNQAKEELRGQRAITVNDFLKFPDIIQNASNIVLSSKLYNGKPVISFIQNGDEKVTVSAVVSDKRMDLFVQTAFVNTKKGNLATPTVERATVNTPEASSGTVSNTIISNPDGNVKHYLGLNKDGEFDIMAPPKPSVTDRAGKLTKRFGKYETGVKGLKSDLAKLIELANEQRIGRAMELAQEMSKRFKGINGVEANEATVLRNLNNTVISQQLKYNSYKIEQENKAVQEKLEKKIEKLDKEITELEGYMYDSHKYHEEMEKKRIDREDRAKNLKDFRSMYGRLNTRLDTNSDAKHIPQYLKEVIGTFIKTFKTGFVEIDGKRKRRRITRKDISDFIEQYRAVESDSNDTPNMAFDESIIEFLGELRSKAEKFENGFTISDLDAYEVLMLSNVANNLMQMVKLAEETFRDGKTVKFKELSTPCIRELKSQKDNKNARNRALSWLHNLEQGNITPPYFFKNLGEGFYKLFNDIVEGQGKWALYFNAAKEYVEKISQKYNYSKWKNETVILHTERGQDIKLTIEQAMQMYATVRRQIGNRRQDAQHLNIGGIVLKDAIDSSNINKIRKDLKAIEENSELNDSEKSSKRKKVWSAFHEVSDNKAIQLSINDLLIVGDLLNEEQKGYADAWVKYLSKNMAAL